MTSTNTNKQIKQQEMILRQSEVASLHIRGVSIKDIASKFNVDERTINRDVQEVRRRRLQMFESSDKAKQWVRDELSDTIGYLDEMRNLFLQQSFEFKSEVSKSRALWYSVQTANLKADAVKSLMQLIFDIQIATSQLYSSDDYEKDN